MKFIVPLVIVIALATPFAARADQTSHHAAAEALLNGMEMDKVMSQTIDQMLKLQIRQNPSIALTSRKCAPSSPST